MKDKTIKFDPAGFFIIDGQDYQDLKKSVVITIVNNETVKLDLNTLDERVYSPAVVATQLAEQIQKNTEQKVLEEAIAVAVEAINPKPVEVLPEQLPPEPSPVEIVTP